MSRIGKKPIEVPSNVKVAMSGREVSVESGGKKLSMTHRPEVKVSWHEGEKHIVVAIDPKDMEDSSVRAYWGMTRALIQNMIVGVTKGYEKRLEIVGVGWGAQVKGPKLELKVGYASPIEVDIPKDVQVAIDRSFVIVKGPDKQSVGQFAAQVRAKKKPEPYNGKGIKYMDEVIRRKQGKVFGS